jgi:hypothetical protein
MDHHFHLPTVLPTVPIRQRRRKNAYIYRKCSSNCVNDRVNGLIYWKASFGVKCTSQGDFPKHVRIKARTKVTHKTTLLNGKLYLSLLSPLCRVLTGIRQGKNVSRVYSVAAVLYLQLVLYVMLFRLLYFYSGLLLLLLLLLYSAQPWHVHNLAICRQISVQNWNGECPANVNNNETCQ